MTNHKTALILGISGSYGDAMARELQQRGYHLRALVRDAMRGQKVIENADLTVELVQGELHDEAALKYAMNGVDVVVHGINTLYQHWDPFVKDIARTIGKTVAEHGATLLFPGNIYNFAAATNISESTAANPPDKKGHIRVEAEQILIDSINSSTTGARLVILRGGDFFGRGGGNNWMDLMLKSARTGGALTYPGPLDLRHQWAYLPDFARAHADLLQKADTLPKTDSFHFAGYVLTGHELRAAVAATLQRPQLKTKSLPWFALRILGIFQPLMREVCNMRYLWTEEVIMDDTKLRMTLGQLDKTPLVEALHQHIATT